MNNLKERIKSNPRLKHWVLWLLAHPRKARPRWWVRVILNRFYHHHGKGSFIRRKSRCDVLPFNRFEIGRNTIVEDYTVINNGAGDVLVGDNARVGIGTVIIGPVTMGNGSGTGQHVFIGGFNHGYSDGGKNSKHQALDIRGVKIGDDSHIGANSVVLAGVTIGKRCQIGAGSVVTKDIPSFSVAVGNPARVIKQYNETTGNWDKV